MNQSKCRWVDGQYVTEDGEACDQPKREHCSARKTCANHLQWGELSCARCVGRTRTDLRQIVERAALMPSEAIEAGVNSEAANLAGPAADYEVFSARRNIAKRWIMDNIHQRARDWCDDDDCTRRHFTTEKGKDRWHKRGIENAMADLIDDDDPWHPYSVLTRWAKMLAEDYGLTLPTVLDVANSAAFLDRLLTKVANDEEQDFPLMARELKKCRTHLESVMRDSQTPERGAFCPTCKKATPPALVRLNREYAHYCDDPECCQIHTTTDELDIWVCPRNSDHWWNPQGYANDVLDKREAAKTEDATPKACA